MEETINILNNELLNAIIETGIMVAIATTISLIVGGALGLFLFLSKGTIYKFLNIVVNILRSLPFVILLVSVMPLTKLLLHTTVGPIAATVPLTIAGIVFYARLAENSFNEVGKGVLEAAVAVGAKTSLIFKEVLLPESLPSLIRAAIVTIISMIGFSAMAGIVGGGGIGDLAIQYGYYRYETGVMIVTIIILIVIVQLFQVIGDYLANKASKL